MFQRGGLKDEVGLRSRGDKKVFFYWCQWREKKAEINCEPRGRFEPTRLHNFPLSLCILTTDIVFANPKGPKKKSFRGGTSALQALQKEADGRWRMKATETAPSAWFLILAFSLLSVLTFKKVNKRPCQEQQRREVTYVLCVPEWKRMKHLHLKKIQKNKRSSCKRLGKTIFFPLCASANKDRGVNKRGRMCWKCATDMKGVTQPFASYTLKNNIDFLGVIPKAILPNILNNTETICVFSCLCK